MKSCIRWGTGLGLALALCGPALAQNATPVVVGNTPKPVLTPEERAKRDADKVFHWIRMSADKAPAKPVAAAAPKPAAKVVAAAAPKPAGKPVAAAEAAAEPAPQGFSLVAASDNSTVTSREIEPPAQVALAAPRSEPAPAPAPAAATATATATATEAAAPVEPELRLLHRVAPEFPRQLVNMVSSGTVLVRFTVQPDGSVRNAEALKTSHRKMSVAALEAVNQWRFAPVAHAREATVEIGFSTGE
ncbi:energy transducer TonB [Paucibacter sp. JuS9]|uniref:energy transducer TonB n=1 Tax=Paucibacter sp. JuS9 TaxID=3228748 RepID=UPI0037570C50